MNKGRPKIDYWYEFIMTFSNRKSLFSSKKIERFIVFWVFLSLTVAYLIKNMHELVAWDFVEISALWLMYGGYNSLMSLRDKKLRETQDPTQSEATSGDEEGDISR